VLSVSHLHHQFAHEQGELRMYRFKLSIQAYSLAVALYFVLTLGWLFGVFSLPLLAAEEYVPPDLGLPDRRESGGARFTIN
jgi:hypothetical protein